MSDRTPPLATLTPPLRREGSRLPQACEIIICEMVKICGRLFLGQQAFDICFDILGTHIIDRLKMIKLFIFFE